jgi:hypothetical protein
MSIFSKINKSSRGTSLNLLANKWVLYAMLILGVFDVFNFYQNGQIMSLYVFLFVGVLTSFFSKNMIVIIVTAIAISHIFTYGERMSEGFEEEDEDKEEDKEGIDDTVDAEVDAEVDADADKKAKDKKVEVPSVDAIQGAATDLSNEIKKTGVEGLSKETFGLIEAQETLLKNLGKLSDFVNVDGVKSGASKKEGYCSLADAYPTNIGSM